MTDERDDELARRLAELQAPDHGPGFWAGLRGDLTGSTGSASETGARPDDDDAGVVELRPRRDRRRLPERLLVAAAVVLVAVVSAGVVLNVGGDDEADVATDPTVTEPVPDTTLGDDTTTTIEPQPLRPQGEPVVRGEGRPVAVDPTGAFLYLAAPHTDGGRGCEGAPAEALYVERIDGQGGRQLAVSPSLVDATGAVEIRFAGSGEIALVPRCEGSGADVVTGRIGGDGTVTDPTRLSVPGAGRIADIAFSDAGVLVAAVETGGADGLDRSLVQFAVSPSEASDLGQDGVVALDTLVGRRLVTASADGTIRADGRVVAEIPGALDLALSPSGSVIAVRTGEAGLTVVDLETGTVEILGVAPTTGPLVMPDDDTVVFVRDDGDGLVVTSLHLPSGASQDLVGSGTGQFALAPDGAAVFAPRFSDDPEDPPAILEQRLTR